MRNDLFGNLLRVLTRAAVYCCARHLDKTHPEAAKELRASLDPITWDALEQLREAEYSAQINELLKDIPKEYLN